MPAPLTQRLRLAVKLLADIVTGRDSQTLLSGVLQGPHANPPKRGTAQLLEAYMNLPWLRAVEHRISTSVASVQWNLFVVRPTRAGRQGAAILRRDIQQSMDYSERQRLLEKAQHAGELVPVTDHPFLELWTDPNPLLTGPGMRALTVVYLDLAGESFWLMERDGPNGTPSAFWPLPPTWVVSTPTPNNPFFRLSHRGFQESVAAENIVWFVDPNPSNPYTRGTGTGMALADELDSDEYAAQHIKQTFFNRARPEMIVTADGLKRSETQILERAWQQQHGGLLRQQKPFFSNRKLDIKIITQSFRELELLKLREYERDTIIQVFGVPPEILGIIENSNRATIDAADFLFAKYVLTPRLEFLRAWLQERVIPEWDERIIIDYVSPIAEDKDHHLKVMEAAPWAFMVDEWRELSGLQPLEDDAGRVFMVPLALQPTSTPGIGVMPQLPEGGELTVRPDGELLLRQVETPNLNRGNGANRFELGGDPPPSRLERAANTDADAADEFWQAIHRVADRIEPGMRRRFLEAIESLRGSVDVAALQAALAAGDVSAAMRAIPWPSLAAQLGTQYAADIKRALNLSGAIAADQLGGILGITIEFDLENPRATTFAARSSSELVRLTRQQSERGARAAIRTEIARGFSEGRTVRDTAKAIIENHVGLTERQAIAVARFEQRLIDQGLDAAVVGKRTARYAKAQLRFRGMNIARTETIRSANMGQQLLWEQAASDGLIPQTVQRGWIVTPDDRLDTLICEPMTGKRVGLEQDFTLPNGATVRTPPAHPMCRCTVSLVIPTAKGQFLAVRPTWIERLARADDLKLIPEDIVALEGFSFSDWDEVVEVELVGY